MRTSVFLFCSLFLSGVMSVPKAMAGEDNLVQSIAKTQKMPEEQASDTVHLVFSALQGELDQGRSVTIRNFGRFYVSDVKPRKGRNPKTGQPIDIPARKYARFVSSDGLKEVLNEEQAKEAHEVKPAESAKAEAKNEPAKRG